MKRSDRQPALLHQIRVFPLTWLSLPRSTRMLFVVFSYGAGIAGLCLLFPPTHNGATMFLPIVCACWLFRYWGLLAGIVLNGLAFQLAYILLLRGLLPDQAFVLGGIIGVITSLGIGLVVCWLRSSVDAAHRARQQILAAEQARLLILLKEQQATLAYEQQRKINTLKDQFLLNVNHELRTPLTTLGGFLELLMAHHQSLDAGEQARMLQEAIASQEELVVLVDQVLDATKVVSDIPLAKLEAVNIQQLLQETLAHLTAQDLAAYTIHVQVSGQVVAQADPQFLRQVLRNLLANIFKYVPRQTNILIEARQADPSSPVCLSVQDEGPGIPADELPLLFEKFVRLRRDMNGPARGTGLGLYICKQLTEAMGGNIIIESPAHKGTGSRFCLTLPPVTLSESTNKRTRATGFSRSN